MSGRRMVEAKRRIATLGYIPLGETDREES